MPYLGRTTLKSGASPVEARKRRRLKRPLAPDGGKAYLKGHGIAVSDVRVLPLRAVVTCGTPTLEPVDSSGIVIPQICAQSK